MQDYLNIEYEKTKRPFTSYPEKLCTHLYHRYNMKPGMRLLEAGCGRGEFLRGFANLQLEVVGVDRCPSAVAFQKEIRIETADIENDGLPFGDSTFDVIYSKSLVEHFVNPEPYFQESRRVLKPGGILLTLVPDWESNFKIYFDDYTHRTPFSLVSLDTIYRRFEFENISVQRFRQLPMVWKFPILDYFCSAISPFIPVRTEIKWLRWSRELMLMGCGTK